MKIKTITCHDVYNYGASLQAYALQTYLESQNHQVEIIDYKPWYTCKAYNFWYVPGNSRLYALCSKNRLVKFLFCTFRIPKTYSTYGRKSAFDKFKTSYLKCTSRYNNWKELQANPPKADTYVAGSDQIWNSKLENGKDPSFYMQFGDSSIKRISYAASFGINNIYDEVKSQVILWLQSLNAISVRESVGVNIIGDLGINPPSKVLDPVFLLSKTEWEQVAELSKFNIREPYLLVYDIFNDDIALRNAAVELARSKNLKLVAINDSVKVNYVDQNISNAGPIDFVSLIKNAEYVISNSFHATAFSIILNKEFFVYYSKVNISRMEDILGVIGRSDRLNTVEATNSPRINWSQVEELISEQLVISKHYLKQNL